MQTIGAVVVCVSVCVTNDLSRALWFVVLHRAEQT